MFFLMTPFLTVIMMYILAAVLPALFLLRYVYNCSNNKQPMAYLRYLIYGGFGAALLAMIPEYLESMFIGTPKSASLSDWAGNFLFVAIVEEGAKFIYLKRRTWNSPTFIARFDGITFAVYVSLGFAIFENIRYVFNYGMGVAAQRAFLAIPAHMAFAVLMGYFYGRARSYENHGYHTKAVLAQTAGFASAAALHCAYDTFATLSSIETGVEFVLVVAVIYVIVFLLVRQQANTDEFV